MRQWLLAAAAAAFMGAGLVGCGEEAAPPPPKPVTPATKPAIDTAKKAEPGTATPVEKKEEKTGEKAEEKAEEK